MTFAIPPPPPCLHFSSKFELSPLLLLPNFSEIHPFGFSVTPVPPFCSPKNQVIPPLKSSSALPPPTGDKYRPVPNPRTITSGTQGNDYVMQTQVLPPSSRARRVSLAPKTPFPFPFKRMPRRHCVPGMHCKLTEAQQPVVSKQFIFRSYLFVTIYAFLFR